MSPTGVAADQYSLMMMNGDDQRRRRVPPPEEPGAPNARRRPTRGDQRRPVEPTQVIRRDGTPQRRAPLAWSQTPEAPRDQRRQPGKPGPDRDNRPPPARGRPPNAPNARPQQTRREQTHAPPQTPVPFRDDRRGPPPRPPGPPPARGGGGRTEPPVRPRRKRRHLGRWFLVLLIVLILCAVTAVVRLDGALNRIDALSDYTDRVSDTPGTNWLLVGSDSRAEPDQGGEGDSARTDTIMLVHTPPSGETTMVSLPRDSYVGIPGNGKDKLNASFAIGGPQLLTQTVEVATGLHIDHYAQVGFEGFADVVDSLGGIDVCVPEPIDDPLAGIDLPAGCQVLDGKESLGFVRTRATGMADIDRMNHQRLFLSALLKKATSASTLANPFTLWPTASDTARSLTVDNDDHIWDIARLGWALRGDTVTTSVPIGGFTDTDVGNVLEWAKPDASRFFDSLAEGRPVPQDLIDE